MEVSSALEVAAEDEARVTFEGGTVRVCDVAEHAGDAALGGAPGEDGEGRGVRHRHHVGLIDASEALDRGAVEADAFFEGLGQLLYGDGDALQGAEDVCEPEADEFDVMLAAGLENVGAGFRGVRGHSKSSPRRTGMAASSFPTRPPA